MSILKEKLCQKLGIECNLSDLLQKVSSVKDPFYAVAKALEMALGMDGGETKC